MCAITVIMDLILTLNKTRVLHDRPGICLCVYVGTMSVGRVPARQACHVAPSIQL